MSSICSPPEGHARLSRRRWLAAAVGGCCAAHAETAPDLRVNAKRLRESLEVLSLYGRPEGGTFADGVTRLGYSDEDIAARAFISRLAESAGLTTRVDAAGNFFLRRPGTQPDLPPVLFGSHIDSVTNGGNFDGDLGSMAAIEILTLFAERKLETRRTLEAVIWACEESSFQAKSLNGSRAAAGRMDPAELKDKARGMTKAEGIRRLGGDPDRIGEARLAKGSFHAYVELHIEQGGVLEREQIPIGVVEGIVSIDDYDVEIEGAANHAGTTPMNQRQDALVAASRLVLAVREEVMREPGGQVGTVGQLDVTPNAPNVVPGLVRTGFELRDLDPAKLKKIAAAIEKRAAEIGRATSTRIRIQPGLHTEPARASAPLQALIEKSASELGLRTRRMPSGAGHDAQSMAALGPMAMIFVPSRGGISHSPREFTDWADCARGADVLLRCVHALAV